MANHEADRRAAMLLLVDDDRAFHRTIGRVLERCGVRVLSAHNGQEALVCARRMQPDLALVDLVLGSESGLDLLADLQEVSPRTKWVLITRHPSTHAQVMADLAGTSLITKPIDRDDLLRLIDSATRAPAARPGWAASLELSKWLEVDRAMRATGSNASRAAQWLGVDRHTVARILERGRPSR